MKKKRASHIWDKPSEAWKETVSDELNSKITFYGPGLENIDGAKIKWTTMDEHSMWKESQPVKTIKMKTRKMSFNAWIPALKLLIPNAPYNGTMICMDEEGWYKMLGDKFDYDGDGGGVYKAKHEFEDKPLMKVLVGEDWIWIEDHHFILMTSTGAFYHGTEREIIEGDISQYYNRVGVITYNQKELRYVLKSKDKTEVSFSFTQVRKLKYIGNVYSDPRLNKMPSEIKDNVGYEKRETDGSEFG